MIESLNVNAEILEKAKNTKERKNFNFINELSLFQNNNFKFEFKTGLNLIFAKSGAGKSVLLNMLANALACEQGGTSKYTSHWFNHLRDFILFNISDKEAEKFNIETSLYRYSHDFIMADIVHDAQYAYYCDPRKLRGLTHGGAAFDYDFFDNFKKDVKEKSATGKMNKSRMEDVYKILNKTVDIKDLPVNIDGKDDWILKKLDDPEYKSIKKLITPTIPLGAKTILLDEPENALDFYSQRHLFKLLKDNEDRDDIQVIMITHSPLIFMLDLDKVNVISDDNVQFEEHKQLVKNGHFFNANF